MLRIRLTKDCQHIVASLPMREMKINERFSLLNFAKLLSSFKRRCIECKSCKIAVV